MKAGEILLIVTAIIAAVFIAGCTSSNEPQPTTPINPSNPNTQVADDCAWRVPTGEFPFGTCEAVVGAYFNGVSCETLSGCHQEALGKVPFSSIQQCIKICQPELDNPAAV